jgi:hypothetical protein
MQPAHLFYSSPNCTLEISLYPDRVMLFFTSLGGIVNTGHFPHTRTLLSNKLPGVLETRCFNNRNLPFKEEVKGTELGHLFEHMLLEYLYLEDKLRGVLGVHTGKTSWDWEVNPRGFFEIEIDVRAEKHSVLVKALRKTIALYEELVMSMSPQSDNSTKDSRVTATFGYNRQTTTNYRTSSMPSSVVSA